MGAVSTNIVSAQQLGTQNNAALSFIKKNAQAEQELVSMISQSASPSGSRGQNVDITA